MKQTHSTLLLKWLFNLLILWQSWCSFCLRSPLGDCKPGSSTSAAASYIHGPPTLTTQRLRVMMSEACIVGYTSLPSAEAAAATALADDDDDDDGGGGARGEAIVRGSRRGRTCLVQRQINHRVAFGALLPHSIVVAMHVRARRQYDYGARLIKSASFLIGFITSCADVIAYTLYR